MVPSTGIEPVTFPMSRERATAAPTGLKSVYLSLADCLFFVDCVSPLDN